MKNKLYILTILIQLVLTINVVSQSFMNEEIINKDSLNLEIKKLIEKHNYLDTLDITKIIFVFKIDSIGEVHSAHIRSSKNLNTKFYYSICYDIEFYFNLKMFYEHYQKSSLELKKYISITYKYVSTSTP